MLSDQMLEELLGFREGLKESIFDGPNPPKRHGEFFDITPKPARNAIQPASVDLTLGAEFFIPIVQDPNSIFVPVADPVHGEFPKMKKVEAQSYIELAPGQFALGTTKERVQMSRRYAGRVEGRSTLGRLGLMVHTTAGFIDPGFEGNITLEFFNLGIAAIRLRVGMSICQLAVEPLEGECRRPYGHEGRASKYKGQTGVQEPLAGGLKY